MTARKCFTGKMAAGRVDARAGRYLLDRLDEAERAGGSAREAADAAAAEAARKMQLTQLSAKAQANVLRTVGLYDDTVAGLREEGRAPAWLARGRTTLFSAVSSLMTRDIHDVASWANVGARARQLRGEAHARFAAAIEYLRPKMLGFKAETARELDVLRALFNDPRATPQGRIVAEAWAKTAEPLRQAFVAAGGRLPFRPDWRLPNPRHDAAKVRALGRDGWKRLVRPLLDRDNMIDFDTGGRLSDQKLDEVLDQVFDTVTREPDGPVTATAAGRPMLANSRGDPRVLMFRDADAWLAYAGAAGADQSVWNTMLGHLDGLSLDTAMIETFGPNPDATKRFILNLFDREAGRLATRAADPADPSQVAAAVKANRKVEAQVATDRRRFENLWAEVTRANDVPVNPEVAQGFSTARSLLVAAQMGSAVVSAITDPAFAMIVARSSGIPAMNVVRRAVAMMGTRGAEIEAAQTGLVADTLAHSLGQVDRALGEEIRSSRAAQLGTAVIRASGLRRWTAVLRGAFGMEVMAHVARVRETDFAALDPTFREALGRYGIDAEDWAAIRAAPLYEPRPNAIFVRPMDVDGATAEKLARMVNQEMDRAIIDADAGARSIMIGASQPGTVGGELRRAMAQYKTFPVAFTLIHLGHALARGWDGTRLGYGASIFVAATLLGMVSHQARQIANGRDPRSMDPTTAAGLQTWGAAILQGGGLGVFGDIFAVDQTRHGNTWATMLAGPIPGAVEASVGDWLLANIRRAAVGDETHFTGDALYVAARYLPGSSLWYGRLAFQRGVVDQLALMLDDRAPERFRRIEREASRQFGQDFWWRPGQASPVRAPDLTEAFGGR